MRYIFGRIDILLYHENLINVRLAYDKVFGNFSDREAAATEPLEYREPISNSHHDLSRRQRVRDDEP